MQELREELRVGIDSMETMTALLQRVSNAHPTDGLYQAAELQWWWHVPRPTDDLPQLFWFDDAGRPAAAMFATDFGVPSSALYDDTTIVPTVMPDASPEWVAYVVERGLAHLSERGIGAIELEVDRTDDVMREVFTDRGFTLKGDGVVEAWLDADARPEISPLDEAYRLRTRTETMDQPHHFTRRNGRHEEERLRQTSLYSSDLDLVVHDSNDEPAGYGLFWYDPVTATGVVEPMRTEDAHQKRGLARHILTAGIDRLVQAGAERISIGYEPDNPASGHLYRSVGFEPVKQTDMYAGRTDAAPSGN